MTAETGRRVFVAGMLKCPHCGMRVIPQADGICPSCRRSSVESTESQPVTAALPGHRHAVAVIAFGLPALTVLSDSAAWVGAVGLVTLALARIASSEIRASDRLTGLSLARTATIVGSGLIAAGMFRIATPGAVGEFREWIGNLSLIIAAMALGLKGLDRILGVERKQRIADVSLRLWNWLDDQRRANYPKLLWRERTQRVILWMTSIGYLAFQLWAFLPPIAERLFPDGAANVPRAEFWTVTGIAMALLAPFLALAAVVARYAYRTEHVRIMKLVMATPSLSDYFALLGAAVRSYSLYMLLPIVVNVLLVGFGLLGISWAAVFLLPLVALGFVPEILRRNAEWSLLAATLILSVLFLALTMCLRWALTAAERVVASAVEHKDGVVVGASAVLIGLGAVLKLVQ